MSTEKRPPFEGFYIYILLILLAFVIADLGVIRLQMYLEGQGAGGSPSGSPSSLGGGLARQESLRPTIAADQYNRIVDRNLFNADGLIPPPFGAADGDSPFEDSEGPVKTDIPMQLLGTLVHANPYRSIASLSLQSEEEPAAVSVGDEVESLLKILGIFRRQVVFRNLQNQRLEFIDIPEDKILKMSRPPTEQTSVAPPKRGNPKIEREGNNFTLNRMDVKNQLDDYMSLAKTAKAVPYLDPATGEMAGFKITRMLPNSLLGDLGIQPGDVITGVDGEDITSANKALEIFGSIKGQVDSVDQLTISIQRNGRPQDLNFNVK